VARSVRGGAWNKTYHSKLGDSLGALNFSGTLPKLRAIGGCAADTPYLIKILGTEARAWFDPTYEGGTDPKRKRCRNPMFDLCQPG